MLLSEHASRKPTQSHDVCSRHFDQFVLTLRQGTDLEGMTAIMQPGGR